MRSLALPALLFFTSRLVPARAFDAIIETICTRDDRMPRYRYLKKKEGLYFLDDIVADRDEKRIFIGRAMTFPSSSVVVAEQRARVHSDAANVSSFFLLETNEHLRYCIIWAFLTRRCTSKTHTPELEVHDYINLVSRLREDAPKVTIVDMRIPSPHAPRRFRGSA